MNNIKSKINTEVADFHKWNMIWPNELWIGENERLQLENYLNDNGPISLASGPITLDKKSSLSFEGLKIRLKDKDSYFKVYYNPHY